MKTFKPYYAVIFTSTRTEEITGYAEMSELMETLAKKQEGFISMDSARSDVGITVSYWKTLDAIKNWKQQTEHVIAQKKGIQEWYSWYQVRICKVEREYDFNK
ncbi:antibiotic biosynthesis monooxygenase [Lacinutrix neustonica]|uniref:Antibiotic biosynthesis monooxygenase n=1 Tax=Lacinutrix neustonica TaxID=2980107 RepID=A0A9E8SCD8_9FLAO|nr:antibiotic biosynthesis monooxygenase [Lacinutrix neustonica]WAC00906.1 antibiotic biosynthesis monooxygenase [Lacinutrix neustonica]